MMKILQTSFANSITGTLINVATICKNVNPYFLPKQQN